MLKIIFFLVFLFSNVQAFLQTEQKIIPWIKETHYTDCEMMVRHYVINKQGRCMDSITMPKQEVDFFLRLLTSVYRSDSTVFSKHLFYYSAPRHSRLEVMFDPEQKWVKKLFDSNGITKNKEYNAILAPYNFDLVMVDTRRFAIAYESEKILNLKPLAMQLRKIEGVKSTFEFALMRTPYADYDWISNILELKFYDPLTEGEGDGLPDIYWKYKITNDKVNMIYYKNKIAAREYSVVKDLSLQFYLCAQPSNNIDPWIKQNYETDCKAMVRQYIIYRSNLYRDSIYMPQKEVDLYLSLLSAVYEVNDSVFKKYDIHNTDELYTEFSLSFDQTLPWVKTLFKTKGKTGNEKFDAILDQYGFTCSEVNKSMSMAYFRSPEILNASPIINLLHKIDGVDEYNIDEIMWLRIKLKFDPDKNIIEFFHFSDLAEDNDWDARAEIYWKYKIENCKAVLIEFYNNGLE